MSRPMAGADGAALSRDLADFLIELSIGLHKNAIYPPGHPLLGSATAGIARRLAALLQDRQTLSLGVARHQLIIEGVATDDGNPVLRDLAQRLHRHHLGAVKFSRGVSEAEVADVLATVAVDVGRRTRPLGLEPETVLAQWPHVRLFPLTFEQLQLIEDSPEDASDEDASVEREGDELRGSRSRGAQLWIGLARAALATHGDAVDAGTSESADPMVVAEAIEEHKRDAAYDQVVVGYLLQIADELKGKSGKEAAALQRRISVLVETLQPKTLERLLDMGGDANQRRKFVLDAAQGMAVDAVVDLVRAAAGTSGQTISHAMVRMLSKLAVHAGDGPKPVRRQADAALRDQVQRLMADWSLADPNPDSYRQALERMAKTAPAFTGQDDVFPCEPERLLQMGLEIGVLGEPVWRAVDTLAARDDLSPLFDTLDAAPTSWMVDALWRHVATPVGLSRLLAREPLPAAAVTRLLQRMRVAAVSPVLDAMEVADERVLGTLAELLDVVGAEAGALVAARLPRARWSVQRVLLAFLVKLPERPADLDLWGWAWHPDGSVRREALRALLRAPETRDAALAAAVADGDEQVVRLALGAAMQGCPPEAAVLLRDRASDPALSPDLRALAVRAAAAYRHPDTLAWLLSVAEGRKVLVFRRSLAFKTPEMLAALSGLSAHWRTDAAARQLLELAMRDKDPEVADAARLRRGGGATPPDGVEVIG